MAISRRDFITTAALGSLALGLEAQETTVRDHKPAETKQEARPAGGRRNVIISKHTGNASIDRAHEMLVRGGDTLDAALLICRTQEDDPNDDSVGYGGLPNEEGVVELDSCCMHGPTRRAGSVGALHNIKNACMVAKAVMEHTGHVMLVGEGAERFAVEMGFQRENLLTERSRRIWLLWKETMSNQDWWGPGIADPNWKPPAGVGEGAAEFWQERIQKMTEVAAELGIPEEERMDAIRKVLRPPTGTIHVSVLNEKGEMSGATTTSGLSWKIPGRLGDSPIIGAGCYTDQDVGSAGATGSGEENIKVAGAHTIVENMRHGMSPQEAGLDALKRIAHFYKNDMTKLKFLDMVYYVLRNDGAYAGVSLWSLGGKGQPKQFAVHDGTTPKGRLENTVGLFPGTSINWPPIPSLPKGA